MSSLRAIRPVRRNSKASARLDFPLLLGPHTTPISPGSFRVCSALPNARKPLTVSDLILGAFKIFPNLLETCLEDGKARVYHLMLGHDSKAYTNPAYRRLLEQGIRWAADKP